MALYESGTPRAFLPEEIGDLIVRPAMRRSIAAQSFGLVGTTSSSFRVPIVADDPTAAWTAEGAEITPSDITPAEVVTVPAKLAGLSIISNELANDSSPAAAQVVGDGLARDLAKQLDAAAFGNLAAPAPAGLESVIAATGIAPGTAYSSLDPFAEALSNAETLGVTITSFVTDPATALTLAQLRSRPATWSRCSSWTRAAPAAASSSGCRCWSARR